MILHKNHSKSHRCTSDRTHKRTGESLINKGFAQNAQVFSCEHMRVKSGGINKPYHIRESISRAFRAVPVCMRVSPVR